MQPIERDEDDVDGPGDRRRLSGRSRCTTTTSRGRPRAAGARARSTRRSALQHARDLAWRALNRRERTVAELARLLERKRVEPAVIDEVVGELQEQGYLDDAGYAQRFAEDRRRLDGWGPERIERRLRALGVGGEQLAAAVDRRDSEDELEAALALLRAPLPRAAGDAARRASARSACSCARATSSSSRTTRCAATRASPSSTERPVRCTKAHSVCAGTVAVLRSGEATDRARRAAETPANQATFHAESQHVLTAKTRRTSGRSGRGSGRARPVHTTQPRI